MNRRQIPRQQRGPDGKKLCRNCQGQVPSNRRSYCSRKCADDFAIKYFPSFSRTKLFERDHGVCAKCGCDTELLRRVMRRVYRPFTFSVLLELGFRAGHGFGYKGTYWQAEHIKEVVNGGWGLGLENFRTLCTPCHKEETKRLAGERATKKRLDKQKLDGTLPSDEHLPTSIFSPPQGDLRGPPVVRSGPPEGGSVLQ